MPNFFEPIWNNQYHTWKNKVTPIVDATSPLDFKEEMKWVGERAQELENLDRKLELKEIDRQTYEKERDSIYENKFELPFYSGTDVFSGYINLNEFGDRLLTTVTLAVAGLQYTAVCLLNALINVIESLLSLSHLDIGKAASDLWNAAQNLILAVATAIHTIAVTAWQFAATFFKLIPTAFVAAGQFGAMLFPQAGNKESIDESETDDRVSSSTARL